MSVSDGEGGAGVRAWRPLKPTGAEGVVEEGGRRMRDATRRVDEERKGGAERRGAHGG